MKKLLSMLLLLVVTSVSAQDVIVKKDGSTILSKVIEVTTNEIKYKKFSHQEGPMYSIALSEILSVNYENGEKEEYATAQLHTEGQNSNLILKAGTDIPIQIVSPIKAADVEVGQNIAFKVNRDISVNDVTVIPFGTQVRGIVYEAKKSSWWGTKGRLGIHLKNIQLPKGGQIPLKNGNVYVTGTNRTTLSVLLFLFVTIPACAICGSKAQIPIGYETMANVAEDVIFDKSGNVLSLNSTTISPEIKYPCKANLTIGNKTINAIIVFDDGDFVTYINKSEKGSMKGMKKKILKSMITNIQYH